MTPDEAWRTLTEGNRRFAEDRAERPNADLGTRRAAVAGQAPFAAVLGCSDSRVAAELVFDRGLGDLFVVRTAGHVVDTAVLGSLEFAVDALGVALVVVLGHHSCGAVAAAVATDAGGPAPGGFVRDVVDLVTPSVHEAAGRGRSQVDEVVRTHAEVTAHALLARSDVLRERTDGGGLGVVAAAYDLAEGVVAPVWSRGVTTT
ncbi:carbonic anhydrase [Aquipuribacter nitratireducens]|uniref:Carbonic anhydrase n=1 Tax=Aquipuribacter nitratireducens TaxID=650104 RepID=A0ABW0GLJ7_9MICO